MPCLAPIPEGRCRGPLRTALATSDRPRDPSDLTDEEWALIRPGKPAAGEHARGGRAGECMCCRPAASGGRSRRTCRRARRCMNTSDLWTWDRTLDRIHHALYATCRKQGGVRLLPPDPSSTCRGDRSRPTSARQVLPITFWFGLTGDTTVSGRAPNVPKRTYQKGPTSNA
jgi:hypothetical protein